MEINVWMQWFVQVATFLSNRFASSSDPSAQPNGGASPNALASDVALTSTSKSVTTLVVTRDPKKATKDAHFGDMVCNGEWICYTMERIAVEIQEGIYEATLDKSPHLGYICPHLKVPERDMAAGGDAGIRIHVANEPHQVEGCIAVGLNIDGDALDNSKAAFDKMMAIVPENFTVEVVSLKA